MPGWLGAGLALIVLAIAVIDARWFIIPNELSAAGFALALVNAAVTAPNCADGKPSASRCCAAPCWRCCFSGCVPATVACAAATASGSAT